MENNFVVHGPAEERMRVADDSSMRCALSAGVQQSLKLAGRAIDKKRTNRSWLRFHCEEYIGTANLSVSYAPAPSCTFL